MPGKLAAGWNRPVFAPVGVQRSHHLVRQLVGSPGAPFPGQQTWKPPTFERLLGLVEDRPGEAEGRNRRRDCRRLYPHASQHLVLHLHQVVGVEEGTAVKECIGHRLGMGVERPFRLQGLLPTLAGSSRHVCTSELR